MVEMTTDEVIAGLQKLEIKFVEALLDRVRQRTPVLSGKLQAAWESEITNRTYNFSNPVEYAGHVEFGTETQAPVSMLTTTLTEAEQIMEQVIQQEGLNLT